jgi:hypothetical protein
MEFHEYAETIGSKKASAGAERLIPHTKAVLKIAVWNRTAILCCPAFL